MKMDLLSESFQTFESHQIIEGESCTINGGTTYCLGGDGLGNTLQITDNPSNGTYSEQRDTEKVIITEHT